MTPAPRAGLSQSEVRIRCPQSRLSFSIFWFWRSCDPDPSGRYTGDGGDEETVRRLLCAPEGRDSGSGSFWLECDSFSRLGAREHFTDLWFSSKFPNAFAPPMAGRCARAPQPQPHAARAYPLSLTRSRTSTSTSVRMLSPARACLGPPGSYTDAQVCDLLRGVAGVWRALFGLLPAPPQRRHSPTPSRAVQCRSMRWSRSVISTTASPHWQPCDPWGDRSVACVFSLPCRRAVGWHQHEQARHHVQLVRRRRSLP